MNQSKNEQKDNAVITVSDIQTILNDYRIGKKPLAKLLGWGETTIIRYIEGDIPTSEYSDKLKAILDDPSYYYEILLANRDNLTGVAFKKSRKAVLEKIMSSKINVVAQYVINLANGDIAAGTIQTMLYYVQAFSLALYNREMFEEDYRITPENTPFIQLHENMKKRNICVLEMKEDSLTNNEKELIENIYSSFAWYGPRAFKAITAYEKTLLRISRDKENNKIVSKDTIRTYFKDIINQYDIEHANDIHKYPDSRIMEIRGL